MNADCYIMNCNLTEYWSGVLAVTHCFSEKIRLDVSSESSARQRIHMKNQALFP